MISYNVLNATIRSELVRRQKTQKQLADFLGIARTTLVNRMANNRSWTVDDLSLTSDFLGMSLSGLLDQVEHDTKNYQGKE